MTDKDIIVVGYPKSGNTWLSRLFGDILDCPVTGWGSAHPLAEEGADRPGIYRVRQLHVLPVYGERETNFNAWEYCVPMADGEKIAIIHRNPLDVIMSVKHYWNIEKTDVAIEAVLFGKEPTARNGRLVDFYDRWYKVQDVNAKIWHVEYDDMLKDTAKVIERVMTGLGIEYYPDRVPGAVDRQSFEVRRKEIAESGSKYNYGSTIQSHNLHRGRSGDGKREMTEKQIAFIRQNLPKAMVDFYGI